MIVFLPIQWLAKNAMANNQFIHFPTGLTRRQIQQSKPRLLFVTFPNFGAATNKARSAKLWQLWPQWLPGKNHKICRR